MDSGIVVILATVILFTIVGISYSRGKSMSVEKYISARKSMSTVGLVATLLATSMGAWILFSPAETTVIAGLVALVGYALGSASALFAFIWLGSKVRERMPQGHSLTEYVFHRFGKGMYILVLITSVFYMGVFLAAELTGIALAAQLIYDVPLFLTALLVGGGTLLYTAFGGLRATLFTDKVQAGIMVPLLIFLVMASAAFLGGFGEVTNKAAILSPETFSLTSIPGWEFGLTLLIAILAAELFNQAGWQRVYVAKTDQGMKKGFMWAGLLVIPIIIAVGFFGLFAISEGVANEPSIAMFSLIESVMPQWVIVMTMILAVTLIMSSMDSLLNGIVSLLTVDLVRLKPKIKQATLMNAAKGATVLIAFLAILIATKGHSVLYLFLIADLVCAAAVFPTFYGLFSKKISGQVALIASILGIIAGASLFPDPTFARGNLLHSFIVAFAVPALVCVVFGRSGKNFNFAQLKKKVVTLRK